MVKNVKSDSVSNSPKIHNITFLPYNAQLADYQCVPQTEFCKYLQAISLPNNLTSIEKNMFDNCGELKYLAIPSSVTSIKEYALNNCFSLRSIYCFATTPPSSGVINFADMSGVILYVPAGTVDAYKNYYGWMFTRIEEIDPDNLMDHPGYLYALLKSGSGSSVKGDVNGDNEVNISDVSALVNILLKK